jgi:heme/copper-type cytochrome/quinol oxidase subunit 1
MRAWPARRGSRYSLWMKSRPILFASAGAVASLLVAVASYVWLHHEFTVGLTTPAATGFTLGSLIFGALVGLVTARRRRR